MFKGSQLLKAVAMAADSAAPRADNDGGQGSEADSDGVQGVV